MNPPGVYDKDPTGFFFIPTYDPESKNFYIRAAIEDPRPILGHEMGAEQEAAFRSSDHQGHSKPGTSDIG